MYLAINHHQLKTENLCLPMYYVHVETLLYQVIPALDRVYQTAKLWWYLMAWHLQGEHYRLQSIEVSFYQEYRGGIDGRGDYKSVPEARPCWRYGYLLVRKRLGRWKR